MRRLLVIPARWGSSRFPGKPLAMIAGRPLLARTIDLARRAMRGDSDVGIVAAVDDPRVEALARAEGCRTVWTDPDLSSGSSRALAAAEQQVPPPAAVINLQGDAPFVPPEALRGIIAALAKGAAVATPVVQLDWVALDALRLHKLDSPFSGTTCIVAADGTARWFSKTIIPAIRGEEALRRATKTSPVLRHLGMYGYSLDALRRFDAAATGCYEQLEGLEQLRLIELGIPITAVAIPAAAGGAAFTMSGIDTPADLALAERFIADHGDPFGR